MELIVEELTPCHPLRCDSNAWFWLVSQLEEARGWLWTNLLHVIMVSTHALANRGCLCHLLVGQTTSAGSGVCCDRCSVGCGFMQWCYIKVVGHAVFCLLGGWRIHLNVTGALLLVVWDGDSLPLTGQASSLKLRWPNSAIFCGASFSPPATEVTGGLCHISCVWKALSCWFGGVSVVISA